MYNVLYYTRLKVIIEYEQCAFIYMWQYINAYDRKYIDLLRLETLIINNIISGGSLHELQTLGRESFKLHPMAQFALSDSQWT